MKFILNAKKQSGKIQEGLYYFRIITLYYSYSSIIRYFWLKTYLRLIISNFTQTNEIKAP